MEHLSRRTTRDVEHLLIVTDPTPGGLLAAGRIAALRNDLDIGIQHAYLVVNRVPDGLPASVSDRLDDVGVRLLGTIPTTAEVAEYELAGRPLVDLPQESAACGAVATMLETML